MKIFDTGDFKVYRISQADFFENILTKVNQSIFVVGKGTIDFYLGEDYYGKYSAPSECIKDVVDKYPFESYAEILEKYKRFTVKSDNAVCYCISSERHKNAHTVIGEVNKYSKGETVTFDTDYILIADGSISIGNNKYNTDTVLSKPKTVTITQDCVIASFNVRKK